MKNPTRIPRFSRGNRLKASELNTISKTLNADRGAAPSSQVKSAARGAGRCRRFEITEISGDYLTCTPKGTGNESGETTLIARPYLLRRSLTTWNGIAYTYANDQERTATLSPDSEVQKVIPTYVVGDEIFAMRAIGGTGVMDDEDVEIFWIDLNLDARAWAHDPDA